MTKEKWVRVFEVVGSGLAIIYALMIAMNVGLEVQGFALLLLSALLFAGWAILDKRWAFLALQGFYVTSAIIGLIRWSGV